MSVTLPQHAVQTVNIEHEKTFIDSHADSPSRVMSNYQPHTIVASPSVINISLSREQTRLPPAHTSTTTGIGTPEDGTYFSIPSGADGLSDESGLSGQSSDESQLAAEYSDSPEEATILHNREQTYTQHAANIHPIVKRTTTSSPSLHRTLSTASSLGDDARFEHVRDQINNRFKAIKDSFQDTNFRLPNLPSLPNLPKISNILNSAAKEPEAKDRRHTHDFGNSVNQNGANYQSRARGQSLDDRSNKNRSKRTTQHHHFHKALDHLTGDVVFLGGYRGSLLRTTEVAGSPHRRLWVPPFSATLNITKIDLEVGLHDEDEEKMPEKIISDGMLTHLGPIDVSRRLIKRLRASKNAREGRLRVHNYGYDWRLSPHRLSQQLINFLEGLQCNSPDTPSAQRGATVVAHSLGGLITRHAVNQRPELFAGVLYAGVPQHCVNILGPLRKGDEVLWSSKILTAQVNFTVRTSFALLPETGKCFLDMDTREELPVDFFDIDHWIKHRFSPVIEQTLPPLQAPNKTGIMDSFSHIPRSMGEMMDNIPIVGRKTTKRKNKIDSTNSHHRETSPEETVAEGTGILPNTDMSTNNMSHKPQQVVQPTLPRDKALEYLERTLARTVQFKKELVHNPDIKYPPHAVIYGKSEPTVSGARVRGYDGIPRADAYDNLTFGSGDGVVLARAAMLPNGYTAVKGGVVSSERGHISLLGDLEAVGRCFVAMMKERRIGERVERSNEIVET